MTKAELRRQASLLRAATHRVIGREAAHRLAHLFHDGFPWRNAAIIAGYVPMADELDLMPLLDLLAAVGAELALPVVIGPGQSLIFRRWSPGEKLEQGVFGTSHPGAEQRAVEPDLLLVPLLAFDETGARLGYGGGYYDRTLAGLRQKSSIRAIGIGYESQLFAKLPVDPHDQLLDGMVTEQGAREFDL